MKILQLENSELIALEAALLYCIHHNQELTVETVSHLAALRERLIARSQAPQDFENLKL